MSLMDRERTTPRNSDDPQTPRLPLRWFCSMTAIPFPIAACRVFRVTVIESTVIVAAAGDLEDYRFQDVRHDIGRIIDLLLQRDLNSLIVDLEGHFHSGSLLTEALASFGRAIGNDRTILVGVSPDMAARLEQLGLSEKWPTFPTLVEGLDYFGVATRRTRNDRQPAH